MKIRSSMKALSLAVIGLAGLGFGAQALAVCPGSPTPPWSGSAAFGGAAVSIVNGGLHSTACALSSGLGATGIDATAVGTVRYDNSASEPRYRFRFYFSTANFPAGFSQGTSAVQVFTANAPTTVNGRRQLMKVNLVPGGAANTLRLSFNTACNNGTTFRCTLMQSGDLSPGQHMVEADINVAAGTAGYYKVWIDSASATEPAATASVLNIDNSPWTGVKQVSLGIATATDKYLAPDGVSKALLFDEFDSRRVTFIGP